VLNLVAKTVDHKKLKNDMKGNYHQLIQEVEEAVEKERVCLTQFILGLSLRETASQDPTIHQLELFV
jgi:hypothetical protein